MPARIYHGQGAFVWEGKSWCWASGRFLGITYGAPLLAAMCDRLQLRHATPFEFPMVYWMTRGETKKILGNGIPERLALGLRLIGLVRWVVQMKPTPS